MDLTTTTMSSTYQLPSNCTNLKDITIRSQYLLLYGLANISPSRKNISKKTCQHRRAAEIFSRHLALYRTPTPLLTPPASRFLYKIIIKSHLFLRRLPCLQINALVQLLNAMLISSFAKMLLLCYNFFHLSDSLAESFGRTIVMLPKQVKISFSFVIT